MSEEEDKNIQQPQSPSPQNVRRNKASQAEGPEVKFAAKEMSDEKLEQLRKFLLTASTDDIKIIRDCYGDNPDVLKLIGLEIADEHS